MNRQIPDQTNGGSLYTPAWENKSGKYYLTFLTDFSTVSLPFLYFKKNLDNTMTFYLHYLF